MAAGFDGSFGVGGSSAFAVVGTVDCGAARSIGTRPVGAAGALACVCAAGCGG